MTAQDLGWGGPGGLTANDLVLMDVPGINLWLRRDVSLVFSELIRWLKIQRKASGVPPLSSSGGYVKRYISGTTTWSNHSWGIAADFNAGTNPYGWDAREDMPPGTSAKAKSLGMRWGGDYSGKKDGMHFEVVVTPARLREIDKTLRLNLGDRLLREGFHGSDVTALQVLLGIDADGDFGPKTESVVKKFQTSNGLDADGEVGPATLRALRGDKPEPVVKETKPVEKPAPEVPDFNFIPYNFPYPEGHYLGLASDDEYCHSGYYDRDVKHVKAWQAGMKARGWDIAADGDFGPNSHEVAVRFQKEKGLFVDGKVGERTWRATDTESTDD